MLFKCHEEQALLNLFNKLQWPKCNQWLLERKSYWYFIQLSSISVNDDTNKMQPITINKWCNVLFRFSINLVYKTLRYKNEIGGLTFVFLSRLRGFDSNQSIHIFISLKLISILDQLNQTTNHSKTEKGWIHLHISSRNFKVWLKILF